MKTMIISLELIFVYSVIAGIALFWFRTLTKKPKKTSIVKGSTFYIDSEGNLKQDFFEQQTKHRLPE
jgi:hypothetical protein